MHEGGPLKDDIRIVDDAVDPPRVGRGIVAAAVGNGDGVSVEKSLAEDRLHLRVEVDRFPFNGVSHALLALDHEHLRAPGKRPDTGAESGGAGPDHQDVNVILLGHTIGLISSIIRYEK